jgi:hypothetical protein
MKYGKNERNYGLENLQEERELATDPVVMMQAQRSIDAYFFGSNAKKKSRKERRREKRKERQKMMEEEY